MSKTPKFTWGDFVVVTSSNEKGSVCAVTELKNEFAYTVEFSDGSDELINETDLELIGSAQD